ncbi:MAG: hypothetical protein ACR2MM_01645 [Flavobacteriaceae bacterium]
MAEKLVVISDMWGAKKGLWITSYLGYLQQYFSIEFYDSRELAQIDKTLSTTDEVYNAFKNGGLDMAVRQLLAKETQKNHYLTFCAGGTIAWNAASKGLPMKSLYAISPIDLELEPAVPDCPVTLLYGDADTKVPPAEWAIETNTVIETIPNFGHEMYSDEKIIKKVCMDLLELVMNKEYQL